MPVVAVGWQAACAFQCVTSRGSTLIEVLIAMLVLTSGVLAMAQLFLVAAAANAGARHTTVVTTLAAQKLEQILSTGVSDGPDSVDHVDSSGRVVGVEDAPPPDAVYTRRWSIEPVSENSLLIRVRVGLSDRSGRRMQRMAGETQMLTIRNRQP